MKDDMKLVKKILNGETEYFTELVERYEKKVYRTCYRFVQNNEDALDLSQEVFIKIYNNLASFKNSSSLSTWIYRVCVNTCLNFLRRKDRLLLDFNGFENSMNYNSYESSTNSGSSKSYNPETRVELKEIMELLELKLDKASKKSRKVFTYRASHNMPFKEIAKELDITPEAARMNFSRTRRELKKSIEEYNEGR